MHKADSAAATDRLTGLVLALAVIAGVAVTTFDVEAGNLARGFGDAPEQPLSLSAM